MGAPRFKLFNPSGEYIGCMKHLIDCAVWAHHAGPGATIRAGHRKADILWTEGSTGWAGESTEDFKAWCEYVLRGGDQ